MGEPDESEEPTAVEVTSDAPALSAAEQRLKAGLAGDGYVVLDQPARFERRRKRGSGAKADFAAGTKGRRRSGSGGNEIRIGIFWRLLAEAARARPDKLTLFLQNAHVVGESDSDDNLVDLPEIPIFLVLDGCTFEHRFILNRVRLAGLELKGCRFEDGIDLIGTTIGKFDIGAGAESGSATSFDGPVSALRCRFEHLYWTAARLRSGLSLATCEVDDSFFLDGIETEASSNGVIAINGLKSPMIHWHECRLSCPVSLSGIEAETLYISNGAVSGGSEADAAFGLENSRISGDTIFSAVAFECPISLRKVQSQSLQLELCEISGRGRKASLSLRDVKTDGDIIFKGLRFGLTGSRDLAAAAPTAGDAADAASPDEASAGARQEAADEEPEFSLYGVETGGELVFSRLLSIGTIQLVLCDIGKNLFVLGSLIPSGTLRAHSVNVGGRMWMSDTSINVAITRADLDSRGLPADWPCDLAPFAVAQPSLDFAQVQVGEQIATHGDCRFGSVFGLSRVQTRYIDLEGSRFAASGAVGTAHEDDLPYTALLIGNSAISDAVRIKKVAAAGAIDLSGTEVAGDLCFEEVRLDPPSDGFERAAPPFPAGADNRYRPRDIGLCAFGLAVDGQLDMTGLQLGRQVGMFDFRNARAGLLLDDLARSWPPATEGGKIDLNGFRYDRLAFAGTAGDARQALPYVARREWLSRQFAGERPSAGDFKPQPYEQLARVFRDYGYTFSAKQIAIAKRDLQQRCRVDRRLERFFTGLLKVTSDYGYSPRRSILWLLGWTGMGTAFAAWLKAAGRIGVANADVPDTANFHPLVFAVDSIEPFLDLGQAGAFRALSPGLAFAWASYSVIGLLLLSVTLLTLSGVMRSD